MTIFAWLFIGHFIGDWMLTNDWMARSKRGRWWSAPCVVHCLVYSVTLVLIAWFGSGRTAEFAQLTLLFTFILLSHWLIDGFNLAQHWGRVINQTQNAPASARSPDITDFSCLENYPTTTFLARDNLPASCKPQNECVGNILFC